MLPESSSLISDLTFRKRFLFDFEGVSDFSLDSMPSMAPSSFDVGDFVRVFVSGPVYG